MRRVRSNFARWSMAIALLFAWLSPAAALAKDDTKPLPPYDVSGLPHQRVWLPWLFAFLFAAGVIAIGFKNPHRTHLD